MRTIFAASGVENLITLLVLLGFAIASLLLKKRQQGEEDSGPRVPPQRPRQTPQPGTPSPAPGSPPARPRSWEEELRRLLEGEPPESESPPVIVPPPIPRTQPVLARPVEAESARGLPVRLAGLTHSAEIYEKASHLGSDVQTHLRGVQQRVAMHAPARQSGPASPEMERARALLRNRESIRSAIVASVILGPSKASEG